MKRYDKKEFDKIRSYVKLQRSDTETTHKGVKIRRQERNKIAREELT